MLGEENFSPRLVTIRRENALFCPVTLQNYNFGLIYAQNLAKFQVED